MPGKVLDAGKAVKLIKSGDTITICGIAGLVLPQAIMAALEARFLTEGEPRGLTWFDPTPTGAGPGYEHLSYQGLLKRSIVSTYPFYPELMQLVATNQLEGYCFPLGTAHFLVREIAAGRRGYLTKVGLHTYVDPRHGGGKMNQVTNEDLIELKTIDGEEYLYYKAFPIDVAILRGTTADEDGNITMEEEPLRLGVFNQALAAKASGGKVIAQVKRLAARGSLDPALVVVPGELVDAIVVDPGQHQNETFPDRYLLGLDGRIKVPVGGFQELMARSPTISMWSLLFKSSAGQGQPDFSQGLPLTPEKVIARRAALELKRGMMANVGGGLPLNNLAPVTLEEGVQDLVTLTVEHGSWGGINNATSMHVNPAAFLNYVDIFNLYNSGLLDVTFLGMLEADREGNVNLLRYGPTLLGPGGAMDIAQGARKVIFCGTFTANGVKAVVEDGRLRIDQEGTAARLVNRVQGVTHNGREMLRQGKEVLYITERAVFSLTDQGPMLIEVAPGVDLERDVLGMMGFRPVISPQLKQMDARLFRRESLGLRQKLLSV